jgi:hypothetical protein
MREPPRRWPHSQKLLLEKRPGSDTLPNRTSGTTSLELRAHLNPSKGPRATPVSEILYPSLGARIGIFGRAAATKYASPRGDGVFPAGAFFFQSEKAGAFAAGARYFVAAALPNILIRALELGDRIPLTSVARGPFEGLRCARSFSAVVPLVRFGRVSEPGRFSKGIFWLWGHRRGRLAHFWRQSSAPKDSYTRPQPRRQDFSNWCRTWACGRV